MTKQKDKSISPDGKWKVTFDTNLGVTWMQLTETQPQVKIKEPVKIEISPEMEKKMNGNWTIGEIVESMKRNYPEIWKQ